MKRSNKLYVAFVDFRKCFDSIPRPALWYKLLQKGVSQNFVRLLKGIYDRATFCVKIDQECVSETVPSLTGVLQGDQLSPLLFLIFIDDLIQDLTEVDSVAPKVSNRRVPSLLFADDTTLLSRSIFGLQRLLDRLAEYCNYWQLQVNVSKTKIMCFSKATRLTKDEKWFYKGQKLEVVREFRYLGVIFSSNGK